MGKRKRILVIGLVVVIALSSFVAAYYWYRSTRIDTSWVDNLSQMLLNTKPYPNGTDTGPNALLGYSRIYLYQNGSTQFIAYSEDGSQGNALTSYLNNLLNGANIQLKSVSENYLDNALSNDRVVFITYRYAVMQFGGQNRFYGGYFILEDKLNQGLTGRIITIDMNKHGYSLWAISQ
jgi:hypothetical protein